MGKLSHLLASAVTALSVSGCALNDTKENPDGYYSETKITPQKDGCVVKEVRGRDETSSYYRGTLECPSDSQPQ